MSIVRRGGEGVEGVALGGDGVGVVLQIRRIMKVQLYVILLIFITRICVYCKGEGWWSRGDSSNMLYH